MIPAITPPTDNLYKFISLFGLTILLFSVYSLGNNFDSSADNKMKIEEVKAKLQQRIFLRSEEMHKALNVDGLKTFHPGMIRRMDADLQTIEHYIFSSNLDPVDQIGFHAEITKLNVKLDTLMIKQWGYIGFMGIGAVLMIFGFVRWQRREQKLRDKMLEIEHALKVLEKVHFREGREKTAREVSKVAEVLFDASRIDETVIGN